MTIVVVVVITIYIEFELRIETGTEKTTTIIVDIFDIIQTVPNNTCIHLKVDEEQWKISQGSKRQASGCGPHGLNRSALRLPDTPHAQQ